MIKLSYDSKKHQRVRSEVGKGGCVRDSGNVDWHKWWPLSPPGFNTECGGCQVEASLLKTAQPNPGNGEFKSDDSVNH